MKTTRHFAAGAQEANGRAPLSSAVSRGEHDADTPEQSAEGGQTAQDPEQLANEERSEHQRQQDENNLEAGSTGSDRGDRSDEFDANELNKDRNGDERKKENPDEKA